MCEVERFRTATFVVWSFFFVLTNVRRGAGSVRAGLRRGKLLGLRESAKTISKNPELAALRQQDF